MYKVLFAEDEAVMRMAFSKMMDWDDTGFQLAAAVANGAEALAYIEENDVDILVTDLKMPVMDGLELIEALKEKGFRGVILVLSNYTDFELVRKALTRGAADYMLKLNIDGEALLKQLNAAAEILESDAPAAFAALREYFAATSANTPPEELSELYERGSAFHTCLISVKTGGSPVERALDVLRQVFAETDANAAAMSKTDVLLLVSQGRRVEDKLLLAVREIRMRLGLEANALLAPPATSLKQSRQYYAECVRASAVFFYPSQPHVRNLEDVAFERLPESFSPSAAADRYIPLYYGQSPGAAGEYLSGLMSRCAAASVHPHEAKSFFIAVARKIAFAVQTGMDDKFSDAPDADCFISELCAWLSALLENARLPQFEQYGRYKKEVRDALLFIHFHFAEKITLDDVAKAVNLNRNYLCRLFKQETGGHMFGYINDLRMKKAAALIEAGDTYVRGVASAVGIDDQFYFARVFKKYHKVPPSEYGKSRRNA